MILRLSTTKKIVFSRIEIIFQLDELLLKIARISIRYEKTSNDAKKKNVKASLCWLGGLALAHSISCCLVLDAASGRVFTFY